MTKRCWLCARVSDRVYEIIKATAATMGISCSEFIRQAVLEKLQSLSLIETELKATLFKREPDMKSLRKQAQAGGAPSEH